MNPSLLSGMGPVVTVGAGVASNCASGGAGMTLSRNRTRFGCLCNSATGARGSGVSAM